MNTLHTVMASLLVATALLHLALSHPVLGDEISGNAANGKVFAEQNCARCHAVGDAGDSPLPLAPAFRDLSKRYLLDSLYETFAEGISVGHQEMPEFVLEPDQINDLLAYIVSLPLPFSPAQ